MPSDEMHQPPTPAEGTRVCRHCETPKPISEFRRRFKGSEKRRFYQCAECHRKAMREYRAFRRDKSLEKFARRACRLENPQHLKTFALKSFKRLGGVERFTELLDDYLLRCKPGEAATALGAIWHVKWASDYFARNPDPKMEDLINAEVERRLAEYIEQSAECDELR